MSITHAQAKAIVDGLGVTPLESAFLRGVAWHETNYSNGWKPGKGAGSFNMGSITTSKPDALSFQHEDSRFDPKKGAVVKYTTYFKGYPTAEAGFRDLQRQVLKPNVKAALAKDGIRGGVEAMYANKYFLGTKAKPEDNIADYYGAVTRALDTFSKATGEQISALAKSAKGHLVGILSGAVLAGAAVLFLVFSKGGK
jgi:hypothetical protein